MAAIMARGSGQMAQAALKAMAYDASYIIATWEKLEKLTDAQPGARLVR